MFRTSRSVRWIFCAVLVAVPASATSVRSVPECNGCESGEAFRIDNALMGAVLALHSAGPTFIEVEGPGFAAAPDETLATPMDLVAALSESATTAAVCDDCIAPSRLTTARPVIPTPGRHPNSAGLALGALMAIALPAVVLIRSLTKLRTLE